MARLVGRELPEDLYQRLAGNRPEAFAEKAILVCTVDQAGWPHPAILSYSEVVAKDRRNIRLATYKDSSTTGNMRRNGKLTMLIIDERMACYIKGTVEELSREMSSSRHNSKLNLRVDEVLADAANEEFEPGVYITSGVSYKRPGDQFQAREMLNELLA